MPSTESIEPLPIVKSAPVTVAVSSVSDETRRKRMLAPVVGSGWLIAWRRVRVGATESYVTAASVEPTELPAFPATSVTEKPVAAAIETRPWPAGVTETVQAEPEQEIALTVPLTTSKSALETEPPASASEPVRVKTIGLDPQ